MEVTLFNSLSEGTFNTFTGVIFANKKRNNLRHSFKMHTIAASTPTSIMFKTLSPMVAKIDMVKYGSNKLRRKLNHIPYENLSKNRLQEPVQSLGPHVQPPPSAAHKTIALPALSLPKLTSGQLRFGLCSLVLSGDYNLKC